MSSWDLPLRHQSSKIEQKKRFIETEVENYSVYGETRDMAEAGEQKLHA